jgi:integrase
MVAVSVLVSALDAELVGSGYKEPTMRWYRGCWRRLAGFFEGRGVEEFSLDVALAWVDEACGFFAKEQAGELTANDVYLFRVARMLADFEAHGMVPRRYARSVDKLGAASGAAVAGFAGRLEADGAAASTVRSYGTAAGEFCAFAESRGGLGGCDQAVIDGFVATLAGYRPKTVEHKLCAVRSFLRFAAGTGIARDGLADAVPAVKVAKQPRIPSVWAPGETDKLLAAVDRASPCGKRDYAMLVLVTRLGLRGVDLKRLRFADIDWAGNRLSVEQSKTRERVDLPLLKDVGWALIEYIRHGRPACDCPEVFVRHTAPIGPFSDQDHLHDIVVKHARAAHVKLGPDRRRGMHSLRHTLATRLMEARVPVDQIRDVLGHQSVESTGVYLKSSLDLLRQCAIDPDHAAVEAAPR